MTTSMAAERLGITKRRVQALIKDGRLPARKFGRDYMINEKDLELVANRQPGRPRKASGKTGNGDKRKNR